MAKAELGVKRRCLTCATAFYDLNRLPIVCPKCAAAFQVVEVLRSAARRPAYHSATFARSAPVAPVIEPIVDDVLLSADEEEDSAAEEEEDRIEEVLEEVEVAVVETATE
ncbi:MAG: TIGR02300 family protein [Methylocystis sp.]|nr:TIGR02300 family protein [Methylocystis sp.]